MSEDELTDVLGKRELNRRKSAKIEGWLKEAAQDLALIANAMADTTQTGLTVRSHAPILSVIGEGQFGVRPRKGKDRLQESSQPVRMVSFADIKDALERLQQHDSLFFELDRRANELES